jgi:hypothetical protein
MIVTLDSKRRLTVSASLAPAVPGDTFRSSFDAEEGEIVFRKIGTATDWLSVVADCPVPMDDIPPKRREFAKRPTL